MSEQIKFDKVDVYLAPIEDPVCGYNGKNCTFTPTHHVMIDFRAVGKTEVLTGEYCETCATEIVAKIQSSLPKEK